MNEQLLQTIKQLEIKKEPEEQTLEVANQSYTKNQLAHFIDRHDLSIAKSWKKAEIIEPLIDWMEKAQSKLLASDAELSSFYTKNATNDEQSLDIYTDLSEEEMKHVLSLIEHGLAFNVEGQLWAPEETVNALDSDVLSADQESTSKEPAPEENTEEVKVASAPLEKKQAQTSSPSLSPEERIAREKKMRLKYFKKQAKKNKKKR